MGKALVDIFSIVFQFSEIRELLSLELCCRSFRQRVLFTYEARCKHYDFRSILLKSQFEHATDSDGCRSRRPVSAKQKLLRLQHGQLFLIGGCFGSSAKAGVVFDLNYSNCNTIEPLSSTSALPEFNLSSARLMPLDRAYLGASASVVNSYNQLEFFGGYDECGEKTLDEDVSLLYKEFLVKEDDESSRAWLESYRQGLDTYQGDILGYRPVMQPTRHRVESMMNSMDVLGQSESPVFLKFRYKQWFRHKALPRQLSYASAVMNQCGDVIVIGGSSHPYQGATVHRDCFIRFQKDTLRMAENIAGPESFARAEALKETQDGNAVRWHVSLDNQDPNPPMHERLPKDNIARSLENEDLQRLRTLSHIECIEPHTRTFRRFSFGERSMTAPYNDWLCEIDGDSSDSDESFSEEDDSADGGVEELASTIRTRLPVQMTARNSPVNTQTRKIILGHSTGTMPLQGGPKAPDAIADDKVDASNDLEGDLTPVWHANYIPPLLEQRCGHASVCTFEDSIITVGGYAGNTRYLSSGEILYKNAPSWEPLPASMHEKRTGAAICLGPSNEVIVAGGSPDGSQVHRTVERYDHRQGKWEFLHPMNFPRSYTSGCLIPGNLFVVSAGIGNESYSHNNTVDVYDIRADRWALLTQTELCGHNQDYQDIYQDSSDHPFYGGLLAGTNEPVRRASHALHFLPGQLPQFL